MKLLSALAVIALALPGSARAQSKAQVFPADQIASQLQALVDQAKAYGSSGATLGDYKSHAIKLSVRASSGGAEVHARYDDIFFVTAGKATLITGGTVEHAMTGSDGETKGSGIQNGKSQIITKGDVVHIPAGVPHQLIIVPGSTYCSIVIKVKEANE